MSIIQYKSTEIVVTTRKGKSVTLVVEDDKYEIYFPIPIWDAIKLYAGIYKNYPSGFEALMLRADRVVLYQQILQGVDDENVRTRELMRRYRELSPKEVISICWRAIRRHTRPDIYDELSHFIRTALDECILCDQFCSGCFTMVPDERGERRVHQKCLLDFKRCITCSKEDVPLKKKTGWVGLEKFFNTKNPIMFAWTCADCESAFINGYCEDCSTDVLYKDLKFVRGEWNYSSRICCKNRTKCSLQDYDTRAGATEDEILAEMLRQQQQEKNRNI